MLGSGVPQRVPVWATNRDAAPVGTFHMATPIPVPLDSKAARMPARRVQLSTMAVLIAFVSGCTTARKAPGDPYGSPPFLFDRHEMTAGSNKEQTVLTGSLLGGPVADFAFVSVDEQGIRRLEIHAYDGSAWRPRLSATLGAEVLFVDIAAIGGHERLITYEPGRFNWFNPETMKEQLLIEVEGTFRPTTRDRIPHVDLTRDLNRDGRDDLVMPGVDGFWISVQRDDGSFAPFSRYGPAEPFADTPVSGFDLEEGALKKGTTYGDVGITAATVPLYLNRIHQLDYDQDGRIDLAFWNRDHFAIHLQTDTAEFTPAATRANIRVPFDFDGVYSRAADYTDQGIFALLFGIGKKTERTVLHSFRDLNGDGAADLVLLTLRGRSITKQRSQYAVHFGKSSSDGLRFEANPDATFRPRGKAGGMQPWGYASQSFEDFDGDGRTDMLFRQVKVDFGGMLLALIGKSVAIDLEIFSMQEGVFRTKPAARRKLRRFSPFAGADNIFFPPVMTGDVNGDGRTDLVAGRDPEKLHLYPGVAGPELLGKKPVAVNVLLPRDERDARLADMNLDGKQDIVLHHRSRNEPDRVVILMAR